MVLYILKSRKNLFFLFLPRFFRFFMVSKLWACKSRNQEEKCFGFSVEFEVHCQPLRVSFLSKPHCCCKQRLHRHLRLCLTLPSSRRRCKHRSWIHWERNRRTQQPLSSLCCGYKRRSRAQDLRCNYRRPLLS